MIVAASFSGYIDQRQLHWTLEVSGNDATVDAQWTPRDRGQSPAKVAFEWHHEDCDSLLAGFSNLAVRYPSTFDSSSVRSLSVLHSGARCNCTVHGSPSLDDHPELDQFNAIWKIIERVVHDKIGWHSGH